MLPFSAWQGSAGTWRVGVLKADGALDDLTGVSAITLRISSYGGTSPGAFPWVERTVEADDFSTPASAAAVQNGTGWHAEVELTDEEMMVPVEDSGARTYWCEWRATGAAGESVLFAGQLLVRGAAGKGDAYALSTDVSGEAAARVAGDAASASAVATEATTRGAQVATLTATTATLGQDLATEATTRLNSDTAISSSLAVINARTPRPYNRPAGSPAQTAADIDALMVSQSFHLFKQLLQLAVTDQAQFLGVTLTRFPYDSEAAAEADAALPIGATYKVKGDFNLKWKAGPPPTNVTPPFVENIIFPGRTTYINPGTWTPDAERTYEYIVEMDGVEISTSETFAVGVWDIGKEIIVSVRATNGRGPSSWVESDPVNVWDPADEVDTAGNPLSVIVIVPERRVYSSTGPDVAAIDGGEVVRWDEIATVAQAAQAGASTLRPHYRATGLSGHPSVEFDGGDQLVLNAAAKSIFQNRAGCFLSAVAKHNAPADGLASYVAALSRSDGPNVRMAIGKIGANWIATSAAVSTPATLTGSAVNSSAHHLSLSMELATGNTTFEIDGAYAANGTPAVGLTENIAALHGHIGRVTSTSATTPGYNGHVGPVIMASTPAGAATAIPWKARRRFGCWAAQLVGLTYPDPVTPRVPDGGADVAGLATYLRSDQGVTEAGGVVSAWADTLHAQNFTVPAAATPPDMSGGYILFDGIADRLLGGGPPALEIESAVILPDGADGGATGKGFTCTGLDWDAELECWWVGNDGRTAEGDGSDYKASIVQLSEDGAIILSQIHLWQLVDGSGSMQGVAVDTGRNILRVCDIANNTVRALSKTGSLIPGLDFTAGVRPNGLAYIPGLDLLAVLAEARTIGVYNAATGASVGTLPEVPSTGADHLQYIEAHRILLCTAGPNLTNGTVWALQLDEDGAAVGNWIRQCSLVGADAIEGIHVRNGLVHIMNDAGFHVPPDGLNRLLRYPDPGFLEYGFIPGTISTDIVDIVICLKVMSAIGSAETKALVIVGTQLEGGGQGCGIYATGNSATLRVFINTGSTGTTERVLADIHIESLRSAYTVIRARFNLTTKIGKVWQDGIQQGADFALTATTATIVPGPAYISSSSSGTRCLNASVSDVCIRYGGTEDEMQGVVAAVMAKHNIQ